MNHVLPAWDVACGLYAAIGILAAERHRRRTGAGRAITLPLADVALAVTGNLGFLAEGAAVRLAARGSATTCTVVSRETSQRVRATPSWS